MVALLEPTSQGLLLPQAAAASCCCWVQVRSYGLVGYLRVCVAEHTIIESKPDRWVSSLAIS